MRRTIDPSPVLLLPCEVDLFANQVLPFSNETTIVSISDGSYLNASCMSHHSCDAQWSCTCGTGQAAATGAAAACIATGLAVIVM